MKILITAAISIASISCDRAPILDTGNNWQRTKECTIQSEKVVDDLRSRLTDFGALPAVAKGAVFVERTHYSPKYGRCFALINHSNIQELLDPFENKSFADEYFAIGKCLVYHSGLYLDDIDCDKGYKKYLADHMEN